MSAFAYGLFTSKRVAADPGESETTKPPGTKSYVDAVAALVPAEVLGIWALAVLPRTVTTVGEGESAKTSITDSGLMKGSFWALLLLSAILYVVGRLRDAQWDKADFLRVLIPPASFAIWMLLQRPSAFDVLAADWSSGTRDVAGAIAAVFVAVIAGALAYKADRDPAKPKP
jgi:hypothetical protein